MGWDMGVDVTPNKITANSGPSKHGVYMKIDYDNSTCNYHPNSTLSPPSVCPTLRVHTHHTTKVHDP